MTEQTTGQQINSPQTDAMKRRQEVIQATFKDNDTLLNNIRALFFGIELTPTEKGEIKGLSAEVKEIFRKVLAPQLGDYKDGPVGFAADVWTDIDQRIMGAPDFVINQAVRTQEYSIEMVEQAILLLDNPDGGKVILSTFPMTAEGVKDDAFILARNKFIRLVNAQCQNLWTMANQVNESPKEAAERAFKDSAQ